MSTTESKMRLAIVERKACPDETFGVEDGVKVRRSISGGDKVDKTVTASPLNDRQRIIDHGEVFTPPGLVSDMLDLVAHECEREDSRFLEPACGDGNFLAEVLRRRLDHISRKHRAQHQWEPHALLGLACLYGIELLPDNVARCRSRLCHQFYGVYRGRYAKSVNPQVEKAAEFIVELNIVQGDALKMTGTRNNPLVFTEWALVGRGKFKRRLFEFEELAPKGDEEGDLFAAEPVRDEEDKPVFVPRHLRDISPVHYLNLVKEDLGA